MVPISYSCGPYEGLRYYKFTVTVTQGHGGFYATRGEVTVASYSNSIIVPICDGLVHTVDIAVPPTNGTFTTGAAYAHVLFTTVDNSAETYGGGASTTTFGTAVASNQCIITVADQNNAHQPQGGPKEDQAPTNCNHAYQATP